MSFLPCHRSTRGTRRAWLIGIIPIVIAGAAILFVVDPTESSLLPPCQFHALTGLFCPGCGSTRALHALLHGNVRSAFGWNPLLVACLPWLVFVGIAWLRTHWRGESGLPPGTRGTWTRWVPAVVIGFAVLRNLPWPPFVWLAP